MESAQTGLVLELVELVGPFVNLHSGIPMENQENQIKFSELALSEEILSSLDDMGFVSPTPIQQRLFHTYCEVLTH